jgi:hypothetical protein
LTGLDGIPVYFQDIFAVFQIVFIADGLGRKLAGFADQNKADTQPVCNRSSKHKAPGFRSDYDICIQIFTYVNHGIYSIVIRLIVLQQRGNILE